MRSLIRLFIGAVLLCLAWVVLTSGQASAAERPAPARPLSELGRSLPRAVDADSLGLVLGNVLGKDSTADSRPAEKAARPAKKPPVKRHPAPRPAPRVLPSDAAPAPKESVEKASVTMTSEVDALVGAVGAVDAVDAVDEVAGSIDPVVAGVERGARSAVTGGLGVVGDVRDVVVEVPVVGEPVAQVTDTLTGLVQDLPVVGVPSPIVPLPIGDRTPTDVEVVAAERSPAAPSADDSSTQAVRNGSPAQAPRHADAASHRGVTPVEQVVRAAPAGGGEPPGPRAPLDPVPVLPTQPVPTGGAAQGAGDPATASAAVVLPSSHVFRHSGADWRVPRGLPAHPGTRPD